jgi:hypothetical protein
MGLVSLSEGATLEEYSGALCASQLIARGSRAI